MRRRDFLRRVAVTAAAAVATTSLPKMIEAKEPDRPVAAATFAGTLSANALNGVVLTRDELEYLEDRRTIEMANFTSQWNSVMPPSETGYVTVPGTSPLPYGDHTHQIVIPNRTSIDAPVGYSYPLVGNHNHAIDIPPMDKDHLPPMSVREYNDWLRGVKERSRID